MAILDRMHSLLAHAHNPLVAGEPDMADALGERSEARTQRATREAVNLE